MLFYVTKRRLGTKPAVFYYPLRAGTRCRPHPTSDATGCNRTATNLNSRAGRCEPVLKTTIYFLSKITLTSL